MKKKCDNSLSEWRKAKGYSRERLGRTLGLSSYTLWKAEHGEPIGHGTAAILSKATGWEMTAFNVSGDVKDVKKL